MTNQTLLSKTVAYLQYATLQRKQPTDIHEAELARWLIDAGLAEQAFEIAVRITDQSKARDTVILADFGEWLCLDVCMQRRLQELHRAVIAA